MANAAYKKSVTKFCNGTLSWTGNIKVVLIHTALYTVDIANHQYLSDIPAGARVATSPNLTTVTCLDDGIMDADDVTFTAVTGATIEALAAYNDTGTEATSALYFYFDSLSGFPITPSGTNVVLTWDNSATRIWQL